MHANLATDTPVYTSDGQELGKVKEVRGNYFKVNTSMAPDYWLSCDSVYENSGGRARVSFAKDTLDQNKVQEPALA